MDLSDNPAISCIIGKRPGSLLQGPKSDPTTVAFMHAQLEAGKGFRVQLINYTKQNRQYWIQLEVQPVYDTEHQLSNYIGVARDITRDKQELRDQRLETIGNVASGLAHDLNNILAPITLSIEMLKEMYPDSDEMVDTMKGVPESLSDGSAATQLRQGACGNSGGLSAQGCHE